MLIVCPNFPPVNTADGARARMMLPYLRREGWETTVAAMRPEQNPNAKDEHLLKTVPPEVKVCLLPAWDEKWCRKLGFGHISNRIYWPWRRAVLRLLQKQKYDLIFISTTAFSVMALGPYWLRKTGVPYVIDLQDPIHVPGGSYEKGDAPGGWWKYRTSNLISAWVEKNAFSKAAGVIATSRHYLETLREKYGHLRGLPMEAVPFGVPFGDLDVLSTLRIPNRLFTKEKGQQVIFYAGRGGPDLHPALDALFFATARLKEKRPEETAKLRFVFVGTSYAPAGGGGRQVVPIAEKHGVGDLVTENPNRVSYFEVLQGMKEADVALVLGSPQPDYTASKALLCAATAPRMLAILHQESLPGKILSQMPNTQTALFARQPDEETCLGTIEEALGSLMQGRWKEDRLTKAPELEKYSAAAMTQEILSLFDKVLTRVRK